MKKFEWLSIRIFFLDNFWKYPMPFFDCHMSTYIDYLFISDLLIFLQNIEYLLQRLRCHTR